MGLSSVVRELKCRNDIAAEAVALIERCFGDIPAEILKRKLKGNAKDTYSTTVRAFALTLHFYSPKAYKFIRRSFGQSLPPVSTLRRWASAVNGRPGFTKVSFEVMFSNLYRDFFTETKQATVTAAIDVHIQMLVLFEILSLPHFQSEIAEIRFLLRSFAPWTPKTVYA